MTESPALVATPWKESSGVCECCGNSSKKIWGDLSTAETTVAVYFVHWTVGRGAHLPNIDLIIGPWGENASHESRILVSLVFHPSQDGGSFMVIDAPTRAENYSSLIGRSLLRAEVIGTPLASEVFALVDAIWLTDQRIADVKALNHAATWRSTRSLRSLDAAR